MTICVLVPFNDAQKARLRTALHPHDVRFCAINTDCCPSAEQFSECEIVFGSPPPELAMRLESLRWLQLDSTGFNEHAEAGWPETRPKITRLEGFYADPVAETCLAALLSLLRGVYHCENLRVKKEWQGDCLRPTLSLLSDASVVLFGFGPINQRLAEFLAPFRCNVTKFGSDWTPETLDSCLRTADAVVCNVPGTSETSGLFDRSRLALLKKSAVFVNAGRGTLVDEPALIKMLRSGDLAAAALDVTAEEPIPSDHPLWECPNLVLTQHSAGGSKCENDRKIDYFLANFERYQKSLPLQGAVNLERGY